MFYFSFGALRAYSLQARTHARLHVKDNTFTTPCHTAHIIKGHSSHVSHAATRRTHIHSRAFCSYVFLRYLFVYYVCAAADSVSMRHICGSLPRPSFATHWFCKGEAYDFFSTPSYAFFLLSIYYCYLLSYAFFLFYVFIPQCYFQLTRVSLSIPFAHPLYYAIFYFFY